MSQFFGRIDQLKLMESPGRHREPAFWCSMGAGESEKQPLLTHWINQTGHRALYWVAEPTTPAKQLRSFSQALYAFANPTASLPSDDFSYASWRRAFEEIASIAERQHMALFLDEFTYLLEAEPGIAGTLQNAWDHLLKERQIFLAISGSHLGMLERNVLAYQSPLYGTCNCPDPPSAPFLREH